MLKNLKKVKSSDRELNQTQNNVEQALQPIIDSPIIDGVLIKDICLEVGKSNEILHKLGRKPLGFIIVRKRQDSRIWDLQDTNPSQEKTFSIACSHFCQIDIWIF